MRPIRPFLFGGVLDGEMDTLVGAWNLCGGRGHLGLCVGFSG